jgi:hypothetical protein
VKLPCHSASAVVTCIVVAVPQQWTVTGCPPALSAIWAPVPSRARLVPGRPRLPVLAALGPQRTALAGSRVVHVVPGRIGAWPSKAASPTPWIGCVFLRGVPFRGVSVMR